MVAADGTGRNACVPCRLNCVMGKVDVQPANFTGCPAVLRVVLHLIDRNAVDNVKAGICPVRADRTNFEVSGVAGLTPNIFGYVLKPSALPVSASIRTIPVTDRLQDVAVGLGTKVFDVVLLIIHTPVLMCSSVPRPCSGVRITDEEMSLDVIAAMQYAGGTILPAATSSNCEVNHCCPFWCGICRYCRTRHEHSSQYEGRQNSATYCSFCFQESSPPSPFFDFCSASTLTLPQFVILSIACR